MLWLILKSFTKDGASIQKNFVIKYFTLLKHLKWIHYWQTSQTQTLLSSDYAFYIKSHDSGELLCLVGRVAIVCTYLHALVVYVQ